MSWRNSDNLLVKFGTEKAVSVEGGEYMTADGYHAVEFDLNLLDAGVSSTDAICPDTDTIWLPAGARIEKIIVTATTAVTSGDAANLDLGLAYYTAAGTLTELDYDGLLALADGFVAAAIGDIQEYTQGATDHGALVGTVLASTADKYYFTCSEDTGSFTAGVLNIRVLYRMP